MKNTLKILVGLVLIGMGLASAQLDLFKPRPDQKLWKADSLFIGASFTRASFDPVKIWLDGNYAGWIGELYYMDKNNSAHFLFTNKDTPNQIIVLSDLYNIPIGDTVTFMYKVVNASVCCNPVPIDYLPKYTGPNIPGVSNYVSEASSPQYGNRWSVAGRVNDSVVQFGFEDIAHSGSDFGFDDVIFQTTLSIGQAEIKASLTFTDKVGTPLAPGAYWSPANDTVYLTYVDDYKNANLAVDLKLNVINRKGAAAPDSETITALPDSHNGAAGTWKFKIPIKEMGGIPGDKILETYFLGQVTASIKSHLSSGLPDGNTLTSTLNIAYPDKPEAVKLNNCSDPTSPISRATTCVSIQVTDQKPTRNPTDTLYASVRCDASTDAITKVQLIEQPDGTFKSAPITKDEGAGVPTDNILSCKSTDNITVTYVDEIYTKAPITVSKGWSPTGAEAFFFANPTDPTTPITQIKDGLSPNVLVVVEIASPNVATIDTIPVTLLSAQGEQEIINAVETGPNTGIFTALVPYKFETTPPVKLNGTLTGYIDPNTPVTSVVINATANKFTGSLTLVPALNQAKSAYIKDLNGDGAGDHVYIVFSRPVETLPTSISPVFWNNTSDFRNDAAPVISFLPGSSTVVVADFSAHPFPVGRTSVIAGQNPTATLPSDNIFAGQKPVIADSMGPVILTATVSPFNYGTVTKGVSELGTDTLKVTVSEPLKSQSDWAQIVRFTKPNGDPLVNNGCQDYSTSKPVIPYGSVTTANGNTQYTILIDNGSGASPISGDCLFLNTDGHYTDLLANKPPVNGTPIQGPPPYRLIQGFKGYPPVVGVTPSGNPTGFVVVNNDPLNGVESEYSKNVNGLGNQIIWVAPADFPGVYDGSIPYIGKAPSGGIQSQPVGTETKAITVMPPNIATIQVVSTAEYIATVSIFDNLGNFIKKFTQSFGYLGELNNPNRTIKGGLASYLVWDLKDHKGQKAGQGVYVWKVVFQFKNGKQEIRYTRTGVTRSRPTK